MTVSAASTPTVTTGLAFDAAGEAAETAAAYIRAAAEFAQARDGRGLSYALRQAAVALSHAASTAQTLRPPAQDAVARQGREPATA